MTTETKEILRALRNGARNPSRNKLHVIQSISKGWSIVLDDKDRAIRVFTRKTEAISFARKYFESGEVIVLNSDGTIDTSYKTRQM